MGHLSHRALSLLTALFCVASLASATPLSSPSLSLRSESPALDDHCKTIADNDLYGRGVRIGMYLQWAAGFGLRNFESWEARARVRTASNVLAGAVALATVINVCQGDALSIGYLMSYYLTVVLFYAESYNMEVQIDDEYEARNLTGDQAHKTYELHADLPLVFQNVYFTAFTLFGAWYWLKGIKSTIDPVCGGNAALLGIFDIRSSRWTHAATALAIIAGVAFFMVFLIHLTSLSEGIKSGPKLAAVYYAEAMYVGSAGVDDPFERKVARKNLLRPEFPVVDSFSIAQILRLLRDVIHYFLIYLAGPLIAIISVERMVAANHLETDSAFGSAGQIIALFTGLMSAILACWEITKQWYTNRRSSDTEAVRTQDPPVGGESSLSKNEPRGEQFKAEGAKGKTVEPTKNPSKPPTERNQTGDEDEIKHAN
jgi:hypothetical protein